MQITSINKIKKNYFCFIDAAPAVPAGDLQMAQVSTTAPKIYPAITKPDNE